MTVVRVADAVRAALDAGRPVVALESTLISHGLPRPQNLEIARRLEAVVRSGGAVAATVGILHGEPIVGLSDDELTVLAMTDGVRKCSRRDIAVAIARQEHGATTVAGTLALMATAGLRVLATGGIGGVHRGADQTFDISADLVELARTPAIVVCAGAKAILDLPRTVEILETAGVPILGWQTDELPAFYASSSGLPVTARVDSADDVARVARAGWELGTGCGVLVGVPPPIGMTLDTDTVEHALADALAEADARGVSGAAVTPFLLNAVAQSTAGESVAANLALLENNARVAAEIAAALSA
ncbi:MAG TPA: pseudouridine-5'-phosphate glycosidase [Acetobacteraceae bacterium]|jgi:pseudouridine-5'-phosphate glycosidase|nr:pseudouridine-5'-phosphate glycosidase [Acetobacteraceae bacterium]